MGNDTRKAALVTGGARRIGREIALKLATSGYDIALHYHKSSAEAKATAKDIEALGVHCELFASNLEITSGWKKLIDKAHARFPDLAVLINNASVFDRGDFANSDPALCGRQFRINFEAPAFLTQAFADKVKEGVVVNMLDTCVTQYRHPYFFYLLSKKALFEFTKMAAVESGPRIRINGVCPGYIMPPANMEDSYRGKLEDRLPLRKTASAEDVAEAVLTLVVTPSLTGQCLFIDGGESLV